MVVMVGRPNRTIRELEVTDRWRSVIGTPFGSKGGKWVAEITITIASIKAGKFFKKAKLVDWGDNIWFYVCSSVLTDEEIKNHETLAIDNKFIRQAVFDIEEARRYVEEKINETRDMDDHTAATHLGKFFHFD